MNPQRLDIVQLIENNPLEKLSKDYQTQLLERIKQTFDDNDQRLFVASFYCYLKYDSKTDFVIDMDDVWKWLGFSRKDPCKRLIEKHFIKDIDYKTLLHNLVEQKNEENRGGHNKERLLMNVETFKSLCLLANTERSKTVRKYYYKLEQLLHGLLEEQANELKKQLEEQKLITQQQQEQLDFLQHKPNTHGFNSGRPGYVYIINDRSKPGHYKIGMTYDIDKRLRNLNTASSESSLRLYHEVKTYDCETLESTVHKILKPFNIPGRREWFFFSNDTELQYGLQILNETHEFLNKFNLKSSQCINNYIKQNPVQIKKEKAQEQTNQENITETNVYKLTGQRLKNKTGNYKGVFWCTEKSKWRASIKVHYQERFLGYFENELDGAIVYNDYATYINNTQKTNYTINDIPGYIPNPRDVIKENLQEQTEMNTSEYTGVSYDPNRNHYVVSIKYNKKTYYLGNNVDPVECAKLYNQQALYFNNTFSTNYILNDIPNYITIPKNVHENILQDKINKKSSKYYGVTKKNCGKFRAVLVYNKKQIHLGTFTNEIEAAKAYNRKAEQLNLEDGCNYRINKILDTV